ncbi:MAG: hypothetical protein ABI370_07820 [Gammaproteobacteria bacterium]
MQTTSREKLSDLPSFVKKDINTDDEKQSKQEKTKLPTFKTKTAFFDLSKQGDVFLHQQSVLPSNLILHARELLLQFIRTTSGAKPDFLHEETGTYTYPNHTTNRFDALEKIIGGYSGFYGEHFGLAETARLCDYSSDCMTNIVEHINALAAVLQPTDAAPTKIKMTHSIVKAIYLLSRAYHELMQSQHKPLAAAKLVMPAVLETCDKSLYQLQSPDSLQYPFDTQGQNSPRSRMIKEISENLRKIKLEILAGEKFQELVENIASAVPSLLGSYHQACRILKVVLATQQDDLLKFDLASERKIGLLIKVVCRLVSDCCEYNNALGIKSASWFNLIIEMDKLIRFLSRNDKGIELVSILPYRVNLIKRVMETASSLVRIFCRAIDTPEFIYTKHFSIRSMGREIERFASSRVIKKTTTSEARMLMQDSLAFADTIITDLAVSKLLHEKYRDYRGYSTTLVKFNNIILNVSIDIANIEYDGTLNIPQNRKLLFLVNLMCKLIDSYTRKLKRYPDEKPTTKMWLKLMAEIELNKSNFAKICFTDLEDMFRKQESALQRILFSSFKADRTKIMELISAYQDQEKVVQLFAPNPLNISQYPFEMLALVMIRHQELLKVHFTKPENKCSIDYDAEEIASVFIAATIRKDMNTRLQELVECTHLLFGYKHIREMFIEILINVKNSKLCGNFISTIVMYDQNIYQSQNNVGYLLAVEDLAFILQLLINHGLNTLHTCPIDNTLLFAWMQDDETLRHLVTENFDDCLIPAQRAKMVESPVEAVVKPDLTVDVEAEQNGLASLFFLSSKENVVPRSPNIATEPDTQVVKTPTSRGNRVFNF